MNEQRALVVLAAMEDGASLRKACDVAKVPPGTFLGWCDGHPDLAEQYARARERMLDMRAEELEEIGERAAAAESPVEVAGLRLQSDNRKWLLSKLMPKKYGEKLALGGAEDLPPVGIANMTDTQLQTIAARGLPRLSDVAKS